MDTDVAAFSGVRNGACIHTSGRSVRYRYPAVEYFDSEDCIGSPVYTGTLSALGVCAEHVHNPNFPSVVDFPFSEFTLSDMVERG